MKFATAVSTCLSKYATFSGRATRSEFWWFYLFTFLINWIASLAAGNLVSLLVSLAFVGCWSKTITRYWPNRLVAADLYYSYRNSGADLLVRARNKARGKSVRCLCSTLRSLTESRSSRIF